VEAYCQWSSVVSRFRVESAVDPDGGDPDLADPASEVRLLSWTQPYANHNGGDLHFGPDGYLYIASGDGGWGGDPHGYAQSTATLLGKILRIDVDAGIAGAAAADAAIAGDGGGPSPRAGSGLCGEGAQAYAAPASNPFVGIDGCDEIWAYGLRNPWRFSFDRSTGDLFIGDVGQGTYEEIDFQPSSSAGGENWGWRCYEGAHVYNGAGCGDPSEYEAPIHEYQHGSGRCSVTGGYRYRGSGFPLVAGVYLFADYCSGEIWSAVAGAGGGFAVSPSPQHDAAFSISSFGEDENGELYVAAYSTGRVYRVVDSTVEPAADVDMNGALAALSDGLLILRRLFGTGGSALVSGALGPGCTLCQPAAIAAYIDSMKGPFDVDGNGTADALSDGLLVLRYLFGFRGSALIGGAIGPGCTRCTAGTIEPYIAALL
jgi:hypothetical protein